MAKSNLLELDQTCRALNMTEEEVLYLVRTRSIPHRIEDDGRLTFPDKEVLSRIIPAPPREAIPKARVDLSSLSKDDILEIFSQVLQQKAAQEEQQAEQKEEPAEEIKESEEPAYPEKKEEEPIPVKQPEQKKPAVKTKKTTKK